DSQDARPDAPPVTLLSHQYWRTHFAADPKVLGRSIQVNDVAVQIVGILPPNVFGFSSRPKNLWFPLNDRRLLIPGNPAGQADFYGKLRPGSSLSPGQAELTALTQELARLQPRYFAEEDRIQAEWVQESLLQFFMTRTPAIIIFFAM